MLSISFVFQYIDHLNLDPDDYYYFIFNIKYCILQIVKDNYLYKSYSCQAFNLGILNFQRPPVNWKLFSDRFINVIIMTVHASSITEYGRVAISNNFTLGSGITQFTSTNSVWKHPF